MTEPERDPDPPRRRSGLRLALALAAGVLIALGLLRFVEIRTPDRPVGQLDDLASLATRDDLNLVFVLIDTLRADRLSSYGYERETSPVMDALAATGIRFADVRAQSTWTKTSMASLWTATYPATNRITRYPHGLPGSAPYPVEILREAGMRTIGIWRNGWVAPNFGFARGFDLYYKPLAGQRPAGLRQNNPSQMRLAGTDNDLAWAAVEFLRSVGDRRFFLYLHMMDVHQYVYDESADFGTSFSDIYDNAVHWVDRNVGTVFAALQEAGLARRTVLVIASDHGEAFYEHGAEGHAKDLHVETTHVPWILALPFRLEEGIVVESPVENVDIWPTLLDLLGLPGLPEAEGRSLVPWIEAAGRGRELPDEPGGRLRIAHLDRTWGQRNRDPLPMVTVEDGRYRLFRTFRETPTQALYDLQEDPGERSDRSGAHPEVVERLSGIMRGYLETPEPSWGRPQVVPLSDMELGQLRALGYAVDAGAEDEEGPEAEEPGRVEAEDGERGEAARPGPAGPTP